MRAFFVETDKGEAGPFRTREAAADAGRRDQPDMSYSIRAAEVCPDCGEENETAGHMGCQYPQDHN
jgi:hypothetical protein